jgi:ADP-heptose:LPS heptosyltransferase
VKILVLQLTRPGDIFCTVPALLALRRTQPTAEIHFLVRKRFAKAVFIAKLYDHLWQMDAKKLLGDFVVGEKSIMGGVTRLSGFVNELRAEKFDQIINLSFSPSSSFIAHLISAGGKVPVIGYTRTTDFYLSIPDVTSQYFKSQGGPEKSNRVHIADLLGEIVGTTPREEDFHPLRPSSNIRRTGIVCHLGASQNHKIWPLTSWLAFLNRVITWYPGEITLIGGSEDQRRASELLIQLKTNKISNQIGQTSWADLSEILKKAELYIGSDSGPLHLANLCSTPILNLSVGNVRFWETGPTVFGSRVLVSRKPDHLMSDVAFFHFQQMITGESISDSAIVCTNDSLARYSFGEKSAFESDAWSVVAWMYFKAPRPKMLGDLIVALAQIEEVVDISLLQIDALEKNSEKCEVVGVLDRLDEVLEILRKTISPLTPLLDEFRTSKENIPPASRAEVFYQTRQCYLTLKERVKALLVDLSKKGESYDSENDRAQLGSP